MSGGYEELVVNPNERAVSTDIMRLQRFKGADLSEAMRALVDTSMSTDDLDASGVQIVNAGSTSPMVGEVLGGLCVRPQVGAGVLDLFVDQGVAYLLNPDPAPNSDESPYKYVRDPGISTLAVLAMTANASGSTRVDVIECQRSSTNSDAVVETDNRDVFNTVTDAFAAVTVNKVTQGLLTYRVRLGTPGAGFPGTATNWLPLAVASVPNGATTNDSITFWDVRPLVADRIHAPARLERDLPRVSYCAGQVDTVASGGKAILRGVCEATGADLATPAPGLYRLGGRFRRGTPGTDSPAGVDGVDLNDTANQSGALTNGSPVYVYLLEPFGLPRWARYTDASSGQRVPRSPRGILVATTTAPTPFYGCPNAPVALPTSTGLGGTTSMGVCVVVGIGGAGNTVDNMTMDGRTQWCGNIANGFGLVNATSVSAGGFVTELDFQLTDGTTHPANAKAVYIGIEVALDTPAGASAFTIFPTWQLQDNAGNALAFLGKGGGSSISTAAADVLVFNFTLRVPLPTKYPDVSAVSHRHVHGYLNCNSFLGGSSVASATAQVVGFDL